MAGKGQELAKIWSVIKSRRDELQRGDSTYVIKGRTFSAKQMEDKLSAAFSIYKDRKSAYETTQKTLDARRQSLDSAKEKLQQMITAKSELKARIESLRADLEMVKAAKARNEFVFDDSALGRTRELLREVEKKIRVEAEMADAQTSTDALELLDYEGEGENVGVLDEIAEYEAQQDGRTEAYTELNVEE